ncbi:MAG: hypothetical protein JRI23_12525 [Deltaproteobacteria bacterium]|jgi:hypothetical protein|nr:hypothetical protein [Deltaproteobacteria bacterium]MBW2532538.1 hypothetical protein [Deltaproteobacteria bacterium]
MLPLFPEDTFAFTKPYFDFVCTETSARKGGNNLRIQVIRSGGGAKGVTLGMREWAELGWYEMACFGIARRLCCGDAEPLATPGASDGCPLDAAVTKLAEAVVTGDDTAVEAAVSRYDEAAHCLIQAGVGRAFGQSGMPSRRGKLVLLEVIKRARASKQGD